MTQPRSTVPLFFGGESTDFSSPTRSVRIATVLALDKWCVVNTRKSISMCKRGRVSSV